MEIEEGDVVPIQVERMLSNGIIVKIYETDIEGFVHISEISKKWIKKPEEAVKIGQILPAKVINKGEELELSIKKVNESDVKKILKEVSIIKRLEKILEIDPNGKKEIERIRKEHGTLYALFEYYDKLANELNVSENTKKAIAELVNKLKKRVVLEYILKLSTIDPNGIDKIKELLSTLLKEKGVEVHYQKAPNYLIKIDLNDTKATLKASKEILEKAKKMAHNLGIDLEIQQIEEKE